MKSFRDIIESVREVSYKNDKRIARLLKNFKKYSGMVGPNETPGMAALNNWNNPAFRESKIGKAIIAASAGKVKRNRQLRMDAIDDSAREEIRRMESKPTSTERRSRRLYQRGVSRQLKMLKKHTPPQLGKGTTWSDLGPESQN